MMASAMYSSVVTKSQLRLLFGLCMCICYGTCAILNSESSSIGVSKGPNAPLKRQFMRHTLTSRRNGQTSKLEGILGSNWEGISSNEISEDSADLSEKPFPKIRDGQEDSLSCTPQDITTKADRMPDLLKVGAEHIDKPPDDANNYRYFISKATGLRAVAITEDDDSGGAVAVSVGCGYFHDPDDLPGAAHMLEHMLFLGIESIENPTHWEQSLSAVGGSYNAYTDGDKTVFHFTAPSWKIPELLRLFKKHLFSPLLSMSQYQKEVMAIDAEHEKNRTNQKRFTQDFMSFLSNKCEARRFSTGNLSTLCNDPLKLGMDIRDRLKKLHKRCYTLRNVAVVVKMGRKSNSSNSDELEGSSSNFSLDDIESLVDEVFGEESLGASSSNSADTKNSGQAPRDNEEANEPFVSSSSEASFNEIGAHRESATVPGLRNKFVNAHLAYTAANNFRQESDRLSNQSEESNKLSSLETISFYKVRSKPGWQDQLIIYWELTANEEDLLVSAEYQPSTIIKYWLEFPGKNSLVQVLKENGFTTDLTFDEYHSSFYSAVSVTFDITEKGRSNFVTILTLLKYYLKKLQEKSEALTAKENGKSEYISLFYEELSRVSSIEWETLEKMPNLSLVSKIAENAMNIPAKPRLFLSEGKKITLLDGKINSEAIKKIADFISQFKIENSTVVLVGDDKILLKKETFNLEFPHYYIKYRKGTLAINLLENAELKLLDQGGQVPEAAPDFKCNLMTSRASKIPEPDICRAFGRASEYPEFLIPCTLVAQQEYTVLWKGPQGFPQPLVRAFFVFRLKDSNVSLESTAYASIYVLALQNLAEKFLGVLNSCGSKVAIEFDQGALSINLEAHSDSFQEVSRLLISATEAAEAPTFEAYLLLISQMQSRLRVGSRAPAFAYALEIAESMITRFKYTSLQLLQITEQIITEDAYEKYKLFAKTALLQNYMDAFLMGNISPSQAKETAYHMYKAMNQVPLSYAQSAKVQVLQLHEDVEVIAPNPVPDDANNVYTSLHVIPRVPDSLERAIYSTIGALVSGPFFSQIRTRWMDGYIAFSGIEELPPLMSLTSVIQGTDRTTKELEEHACIEFKMLQDEYRKSLTIKSLNQSVKWLGATRFSIKRLEDPEKYYEWVTEKIGSHNFCFDTEIMSEISIAKFLKCPDMLLNYMAELLNSRTRHLVTVKLQHGKAANKTSAKEAHHCPVGIASHDEEEDIKKPSSRTKSSKLGAIINNKAELSTKEEPTSFPNLGRQDNKPLEPKRMNLIPPWKLKKSSPDRRIDVLKKRCSKETKKKARRIIIPSAYEISNEAKYAAEKSAIKESGNAQWLTFDHSRDCHISESNARKASSCLLERIPEFFGEKSD